MVEQMAGLKSFTQAVKWLVVMVSNMDSNADHLNQYHSKS